MNSTTASIMAVCRSHDDKQSHRLRFILVSLMTAYRFELKAEGFSDETEHDQILFEKKRCLTTFSTCCESDPRLAF